MTTGHTTSATPDPACFEDTCPECDLGRLEPDGVTRVHLPDCEHVERCSICNPEYDPTPWCSHCGARKRDDCDCGEIASND